MKLNLQQRMRLTMALAVSLVVALVAIPWLVLGHLIVNALDGRLFSVDSLIWFLAGASCAVAKRRLSRPEKRKTWPVQSEVPVYPSVTEAWRVWRINYAAGDGLGLRPIAFDHLLVVPRERETAQCMQSHKHAAPAKNCDCGIWAVRSEEQAYAVAASYAYAHPTAHFVYGRVNLWGRVLQYERGYRAEHAYPTELTGVCFVNALPLTPAELEFLASVYGVDVATDFQQTGTTYLLPA